MPNINRFPYFGFPYRNSYYQRRRNYQPVNPSQSSCPPASSQHSSNSYGRQPEYLSQNSFCDQEQKKQADCENHRITPPSNTIFPNQLLNFLPSSIGPLKFNVSGLSDSDEPIFEMFGIRLFLDDVIIICLLFFLYQEKVDDQLLYISLIMLLIS